MYKQKLQEEMANNPFKPLHEIVYDILHESIITLKFAPQDKINETLLAKQFDISRSPVHTAIDLLISQRLLERNGKYVSPTPVSGADCRELSRARAYIESSAAYLAARNIKPEQAKALFQLAEDYESILETADIQGHELCDHHFHRLVVESCGNSYLIDMYRLLEQPLLRYRYYLRSLLSAEDMCNILKHSVKSHYAICRALDVGLATVARDEIYDHADSMRDVYGIHQF